MLRCIIRLDLDGDYVLSDLTQALDRPVEVTNEELSHDGIISFIVHASKDMDRIAEQLRDSEAVIEIGKIGESKLLVKKRSSGALPIIREHGGMLLGVDEAFGTERVFDLLVFERNDVRNLTRAFEALGSPTVEKINPIPNSTAILSDRQDEVVRAALHAGYFDWPRKTDAVELADQLGISHPTMLEHLRKAEKKLIQHSLRGQMRDLSFDEPTLKETP